MNEQFSDLIQIARAAQRHAHAPYSRFRVGAALLAKDGRVFSGANVENASFGLTNCAERSALFSAVSAGVREFELALIVTDAEVPTPPCGACRQVLREFGVERIVSASGGVLKEWRLDYLLPEAFTEFPGST